MKKSVLLVSALLIALNAWACPDLSGKWNCTDSRGQKYTFSMTEESTPNGVLYHLTNSIGQTWDYTADGKTQQFTDSDGKGGEFLTVTCSGGTGLEIKQADYSLPEKTSATNDRSYVLSSSHALSVTEHWANVINGQSYPETTSTSTCTQE